MGLAEKRVVKSFQEGTYQGFVKQINDIIEKPLEIEVQWDQLAENGMSHLYESHWPKIYFTPLVNVLQNICADELGKEAVNTGLDKIIIKNEDDIYSPGSWSSLDEKVLVLNHMPTANVDNIKGRTEGLQKELEDNL